MDILSPQTGNEKMDEAYKRMQGHIDKCETFSQFVSLMKNEIKTDDLEKLNKWYLKVIFVHLKQPKHKFDEMVELLQNNEPDKAKNLITWLDNTLFEVKVKYGGEK